MQTFEVETLPQVVFAHTYYADSYSNSILHEGKSMEVTYISEGSLNIEQNGKIYKAKKGDVLCTPDSPFPAIVHTPNYHEHRTVFAYFEYSVKDNASGLCLPMVTPSQFNTVAAKNIIEQLIRNQLYFKESSTKGAAMFLDLLCEIDRCNNKSKKTLLPSSALYTQYAKEYVQRNICLPVTQKSVAAYLNISPEYLCSIFKKTEGISFMKYANMEKLKAIETLMKKEHIHLYEAARFYGYNDPNYVSRLFRSYCGYNITEKGRKMS